MFWLPYGRIPYYGEWLLSFPRAPLGSISVQVWQLACASVILLVSDAIAAVIALFMAYKSEPGQKKSVPLKAGGEKPKSTPTSTEKAGTKKEL